MRTEEDRLDAKALIAFPVWLARARGAITDLFFANPCADGTDGNNGQRYSDHARSMGVIIGTAHPSSDNKSPEKRDKACHRHKGIEERR
jgi:hypothetical protein